MGLPIGRDEMPEEVLQSKSREQVLIRLDTFIRLRWYAIIGQAGAIFFVAFYLQYPIEWEVCMILIAVSAGLNVMLNRLYKASHRLPGSGALMLLSFDVLHLGMLLFITGGLQNPFSILLLAPVIVAAASLHHTKILILGSLTIVVITVLAVLHLPLPWDPQTPLRIPLLYNVGVWVAIVCTLAFTAIYAYRVAEEARKLADALAATELVLQREQYLSELDGLAAAAAHELGTPLATIALVSKEMLHALPDDSSLREDAILLRSQAQRCRDILQKLKSLTSEDESIIGNQRLDALIEEEVEPLRDFGVEIEVHKSGADDRMPVMNRNPGIHYGLGNIIDNAVDFASEKVVVAMYWDDQFVRVQVSDDGPGFSPSLLAHLGEPFVSARNPKNGQRKRGLGLGVFIAKTLLERSGAEVFFKNNVGQAPHLKGACVELVWPKEKLEVGLIN